MIIKIIILIAVFFWMKAILVDSLPKDRKESRKAGIVLAFCLTLFLAMFMQMIDSDNQRIGCVVEMPKYNKTKE